MQHTPEIEPTPNSRSGLRKASTLIRGFALGFVLVQGAELAYDSVTDDAVPVSVGLDPSDDMQPTLYDAGAMSSAERLLFASEFDGRRGSYDLNTYYDLAPSVTDNRDKTAEGYEAANILIRSAYFEAGAGAVASGGIVDIDGELYYMTIAHTLKWIYAAPGSAVIPEGLPDVIEMHIPSMGTYDVTSAIVDAYAVDLIPGDSPLPKTGEKREDPIAIARLDDELALRIRIAQIDEGFSPLQLTDELPSHDLEYELVNAIDGTVITARLAEVMAEGSRAGDAVDMSSKLLLDDVRYDADTASTHHVQQGFSGLPLLTEQNGSLVVMGSLSAVIECDPDASVMDCLAAEPL